MKKRIGLFGLVAGTLVLGWLISPLGAATKTTRYLPAASSGAARVIEVCALGCKYTTLNAACAGETSTAAAPLVIHVFPMIDTTQASCSGEDYLTIQGDGPSSYLNVAGITGENGVLEMGTSTNWTVENMRIKGHRAIISESAGASAGKVTIRNNDLETEAVAADEDCGWFDNPGSGTSFLIQGNRCKTQVDGFTINKGGAGVTFTSQSNYFEHTGSGSLASYIYAFEGIPCLVSLQGDHANITADKDNSMLAYVNMDGTETGCSAGAVLDVIGAKVYILQSDAAGTGTARGVRVLSTATELGTVNVIASDFSTNVTSATGGALGMSIENATTVPTVIGSRFRTTGGATPYDFSATATSNYQISVLGTDFTQYVTDDVGPVNALRIYASEWGSFGPVAATYPAPGFVTIQSTVGGNNGLYLDNTDTAGTNEDAPYIYSCDSATAEQCYSLYTRGSDSHFVMRDVTASKTLMDFTTNASGQLNLNQARVYISYPTYGGALVLGGGINTDVNNYVKFDAATNDASMIWVQSLKNLNLSGVEQLEIDCVTTMPTCDTAGRIVCDGDGTVGLCFCNGSAYVAFGGAADCT